MNDTFRRVLLAVAMMVAASGCAYSSTANNLSMARMDQMSARYGTHFTYMVDNAIARDMSVADIHFVPHTTEINGIGEVRLTRMAELLKAYGGTVRYETLMTDEDVLDDRLTHVRQYLRLAGCDMKRVRVSLMISGGRGFPGDEAVKVFNQGVQSASETANPTASLSGLQLQSPGQ